MADVARIPRRRGGLCGLLLILLGVWGALVPFVGPYFKFAFTPDKAWAYTSGRLYLSVVPGAAAVLGGLLVLSTRSRTAGMFGGLLGAAGGAWFIVGAGIVDGVLNRTSISPGVPLRHSPASDITSATKWMSLEEIGFFGGVGILIVLFGAIAIGRFSMLSARDAARADSSDHGDSVSADEAVATPAAAATSAGYPAASPYPASPKPFPGDEPTQTQDRYPSATSQFPGSGGRFPSSPSGQYPESTSPFGGKSE